VSAAELSALIWIHRLGDTPLADTSLGDAHGAGPAAKADRCRSAGDRCARSARGDEEANESSGTRDHHAAKNSASVGVDIRSAVSREYGRKSDRHQRKRQGDEAIDETEAAPD